MPCTACNALALAARSDLHCCERVAVGPRTHLFLQGLDGMQKPRPEVDITRPLTQGLVRKRAEVRYQVSVSGDLQNPVRIYHFLFVRMSQSSDNSKHRQREIG
eukprot:Polyplicarium_translucidae@DN2587_c0_g1_i2.p2